MVRDILSAGLRVVFVGYNPGIYSERAQHHFAGPGNYFWDLLADSGLTPVRLLPADDACLLDYGLGITNIVDRVTPGSADLTRTDMDLGVQALQTKIRECRPQWVCYLGKDIYRVAKGLRSSAQVSWGQGALGSFVAPNPSRRSTVAYGARLAQFAALSALVRPPASRGPALPADGGNAGKAR